MIDTEHADPPNTPTPHEPRPVARGRNNALSVALRRGADALAHGLVVLGWNQGWWERSDDPAGVAGAIASLAAAVDCAITIDQPPPTSPVPFRPLSLAGGSPPELAGASSPQRSGSTASSAGRSTLSCAPPS